MAWIGVFDRTSDFGWRWEASWKSTTIRCLHLDFRSIASSELITNCNIVLLLQVQIIYLDEETAEFVVRATFDHPYPTTKIIWIPDSVSWSVYSLHSILWIPFVRGATTVHNVRFAPFHNGRICTKNGSSFRRVPSAPSYCGQFIWTDDPSLCGCLVFTRTNSQMNYRSLPKFIPDGWFVSRINSANVSERGNYTYSVHITLYL